MKHEHALRRWSVKNFKSIAEANLEMSPLTLLVGKNSAGKSSIIQSLLLFAQSSNTVTDGFVPLNDALTSLGLFEDAHSKFAETPEISFEGDFVLRGRNPSAYLAASLSGIRLPRMGEMAIKWSCDLVKDARTEEARLGRGSFEQRQERDDLDIRFSLRPSESDLGLSDNDFSLWGPYDMEVRRDPKQDWDRFDFAQFTAAVPINGLRKWKSLEWWIRDIYNDVNSHRKFSPKGRRTKTKQLLADEESKHLTAMLRNLTAYAAKSIQGEDSHARGDLPYQSNVVVDLKLNPSDINFIIAHFDEIADGLRDSVPDVVGDLAYKEALRPDPGTPIERVFASRIDDTWQQFWVHRVKYLGPLREEPRAAYSRQRSNVSFAPLGIKGEFFASFLYQNQAKQRLFPLPDGSTEQLSLKDALNIWLRYLHIADRVEVVPSGRLGLEIQVDDRRNVTSVGTGVSQLLPVLVVCLWANEGTLTLIEQPEIHVEPGAQQLLAEFLLTVARSGRQLLVETHSEYLITRLRLLTARMPEIADDFAIYFAEQQDGQSSFRKVQIGSSGGIDDWPAGFFDQAATDARALMLEAAKGPSSEADS